MKALKMTVEEMLTGIDFDVDVGDDYSDDLYIAYCPPTCLTEKGKEKFKDVLNLPVEIYEYDSTACVMLEDKPNYKHLHKVLKELLYGIGGYCSTEEWDEWFYYPDDDECPDDVSEVGYNPYLGCCDYDC